MLSYRSKSLFMHIPPASLKSMYLHGDHSDGRLGPRAAVWFQVKVRERGLGLLRPRLNSSHVCDDSAAEGGICATAAL